jgi:hypothetical protein
LNKRKQIKEEGLNPYTLVLKILFFSYSIFPPLRFGATTTHPQRKNTKLALNGDRSNSVALTQSPSPIKRERCEEKGRGEMQREREREGGDAEKRGTTAFAFRECRKQSLSFRFRVRKNILFVVVFFKCWSG